MAGYRGRLTENGLVQAIRDIYDFFYQQTGERYTKTLLSDAYKVFIPEGCTEGCLTIPPKPKLVLGNAGDRIITNPFW